MPTASGVRRHVFLAMVLVFVCGGLASADWLTPIWEETVPGGSTTQTWQAFTSLAGGSVGVSDLGGGDYGLTASANYWSTAGAGWAGAYVDAVYGDQGMEAWVDTSPMGANGTAALSFLRYTTTASPGMGFGSGYALAVTHNASGEISASVHHVHEGGPIEIGSEISILPTYSDVYFRFLVTGTDADTRLQARIWADGTDEPYDWDFDFTLADAGVGSGFYNTGAGGIGVVTMNPGLEVANATFDDIKYGTPEPTTMILMATGIGALVLRRRRTA